MIDLGDIQQLVYSNTDDNGSLADATAVTVTVTMPDGTTATPAVVHRSAGVYTADYTTTQAGRHLVHWQATGSNPGAYSDVFYVAAADPKLLIPLEQARKAIGLPKANTSKDEDLRDYLAAAVPVMEDIVGPILPASRDEWYDGGATTVVLKWAPVLEVATITEGSGTTRHGLTEQPLDGVTFDQYGFTVDLVTGVVTRRSSGIPTPFSGGLANIQVTYTSGRVDGLKPNEVLATRRLIRHLWQSEQQGQRPDFGGSDTATGYTPSGYAVPNAVLELCAGSNRLGGFA